MTIDRRTLLATSAAFAIAPAGALSRDYSTKRPAPADRHFTSPAVEREIVRVSTMIADPELRWLFANCYPNTLDTTVKMSVVDGKPDAFVITGDIPCLWLRDSAAQLHPYLPLVRNDPRLRELFRGLIARHARSILIDPYANAFLEDPMGKTNLSWALHDETEMKSGVAERKWEVDSLCYPVRLASAYWQETGDKSPFDTTWAESARAIVRTFREQQRKHDPGPYSFRRAASQPTETLLWGEGNPTRKVGLIHSGFRPSDDACLYPFLVPANLFAVTALQALARLAEQTRGDSQLAADAVALAEEVEAALKSYGTMRLPDGRDVWAYEVDGYGNTLFMDDANIPSLSGLAYLGCLSADDARWRRTAAAAWSPANPWFFRGRAAEGIGGPHVGARQIWPMSLIVRALSAQDDATIVACLRTLKATHAGTGFMHESFDQDDPVKFTREWFAWANGLFGELIIHLARRRPHLLRAPLPPL